MTINYLKEHLGGKNTHPVSQDTMNQTLLHWAVHTQWLTLFHYLFHLNQSAYPSLFHFLSFLVCQHVFIIAQPRYVGTQGVETIQWISSAGGINDYINFRRPHLRHKPLARHKMSLVYPLSSPAPSGKRKVVLIKWDS